ncbi:MAG: hypothetical protein RBR06_11260 [Desulfuromonadaceae bacterium]|nr:hypothetical protein [Desulfuromonadaceae bacterium]
MSISLPEQMKTWVAGCVQSGRYAHASASMDDLSRKDHLKLEQLRQARIEGAKIRPEWNLGSYFCSMGYRSSRKICSRAVGSNSEKHAKARSAPKTLHRLPT